MIKIFVNTPFSRDANSFWRCMGPLSYMAKQSGGDIQIHLPPEGTKLAWDRLSEFDLVFLHRPCRPDDLTVIQIARNLNIPVWADFDDWLLDVPEWNPHAGSYNNGNSQYHVASAIACSDLVTVSTEALRDQFLKINPQVVILPNAYRSDLFPFRAKGDELPDRNNLYIWRGTNTHDGDLLSVKQAFPQLKEKIAFLGSPCYSILNQMPQGSYERKEHVDVVMYWKQIYQINPKVMLFPLKEHFFNHCKSNIAWIEAIHAGAVCVAPRGMKEWKQPGVIPYEVDHWESFLDAAEQSMSLSQQDIRRFNQDAYDHILEKYDISVINEIRTALVYSVFNPSFQRNTQDPFTQLTGIRALQELKKKDPSQSEIKQ